MNQTFQQLRKDLAKLLGMTVEDAEADDELDFIDTCINNAYSSCFVPLDGVWPPWSQENLPVFLKGPISATATLTKGSTRIEDPSEEPESQYAGSYIKIGQDFYIYAGFRDGEHHLAEPWAGESGVQDITLYHNSVELSAEAIQVAEVPELIGYGPLSPMWGKESEVRYRTVGVSDFHPSSGIGTANQPRINLQSLGQQVGTPAFYFVDATRFSGFEPGLRFVVYPVPDKDCSIRVSAHRVPAPLAAPSETPKMPANMVTEILLPLAREELAGTSKHYNGRNIQYLIMKAKEARAKLARMMRPQKRRGGRLRLRAGY